MQKTRINLDVLLPDIPGERDECVRRLIQLLEGRNGIQKVHVASANGNSPQLCFRYDPAYTSIDKVQQLARSTGAGITRQYGHLLLRVEGIRQPRHARIIKQKLSAVPGMLTVAVSGTVISMRLLAV